MCEFILHIYFLIVSQHRRVLLWKALKALSQAAAESLIDDGLDSGWIMGNTKVR